MDESGDGGRLAVLFADEADAGVGFGGGEGEDGAFAGEEAGPVDGHFAGDCFLAVTHGGLIIGRAERQGGLLGEGITTEGNTIACEGESLNLSSCGKWWSRI